MSEDEYSDFFAEFYDILHSNLDDVEYFKQLADRFGPKVLELGSGTGRILIPLAREGFSVTGLEASEEMLDACREKLKAGEDETIENIDLVKGDMRDFHLEEKFDLILAACNLINYLTDISDLKKTLSCIKEHLSDDGVLVIDNSLPDVREMVERDGEEYVNEYENPENGRKIIDSFISTYDLVDQIEYNTITISEYEEGEKTRETEVQEKLTFYFPRELREILRSQGYEIFEERGSLDRFMPINEDSEEMVFLCRVAD